MKKIKVAVIDSGIDPKDDFWKNIKFQNISIINGNVTSCKSTNNLHGNDVAKIIYSECSNIELISIQILNKDNKGIVSDLICAIRFCICLKVEIINLSLGTVYDGKDIFALNEVCELAEHKNIAIIASNTNSIDKNSYPARFKSVLSVGHDKRKKSICTVDKNNKEILFKYDYVSIPSKDKIQIRKGTSFLCPKIVGLYCNLLLHNNICGISSFLKFFDTLLNNKYLDRIYMDRNGDMDLDFIGKHVLYLKGDTEDETLIEYYKSKYCKLELCSLNEFIQSETVELYFFGKISDGDIKENKKIINSIIKDVLINKKGIVSIIPLDTIYNRICAVYKNDIIYKSFYF